MEAPEPRFTAPGDWFEILFDHSPDAIYVADLDGLILKANRTACERMKRTEYEWEGMRLADLHAPETRARSAGLLAKLAVEGSVQAEILHQAKDGTKIPTEINSTTFEAGGRLLVLAIARDISERHRAEQKASESDRRFGLLFESSGTSNSLFDLECRLVLCNLFCSRMIGRGPPEALVGLSLEDLFGPERGGVFRERMRHVVTTGEPETHESEFPLGPQKRWLQTSYNPLFGGDGGVVGIQLISHDITESHRLHERLLQTEKLHSIGILAGGLAHDFNNLLAGLSGNLELLELDLRVGKLDDARERLKLASQVFARAKSLTRQLMTFSQGGEPVMAVHDLKPWLSSWAEFALTGSGLDLTVDVAGDLLPCRCDRDQIGQVVDNLVINARQASPRGGRILVQAENVRQDRTYVRIRVIDQGEGIPAEHLKNVFDPFFTTKAHGTGLGLATSQSIVRKHGGWMEIESEVGRGTTVSVFLPAS